MINLTEMARKQVLQAIAEEDRKDLGLRVAITGKGQGGFRYSLDLVAPGEQRDDDEVLDSEGLTLYLDRSSIESLKGTTIDFVQRLQETGFKFDNPNSVWSDPIAQQVQDVIDQRVNPGVASHGGYVKLLDVKEGIAYITFGGGCQGCGMADVTLKQGVQVMLKEAVPELLDVLDTTDHAAGTNPYFDGPAPGESPVAATGEPAGEPVAERTG